MNLTWHGPSEEYDVWLAALPGQNPPHESFEKAIPAASESYSSQVVLLKAGEILLQRSKTKGVRSSTTCLWKIAMNFYMGHQLWRKVPRMIASIDCPSLCWLGKPLNVQPYFAQLVLLFLLAWSRKERKAHEWPIPLVINGKTMILLLSGRTRPLRSHYLLCESLYPQGNPMHWDSRLDHHQTQEWVLNQWNVCF